MPDAHPTDPIVDAFESHRDRLRAVAYRVLGSHADAEDVVQEAWLRLSRQGTGTIDNLGGWLTTVVGRISLDVLRSGRTRPEVALDDQLPEFTVTLDDAPAPEDLVTLGDPSASRSSRSSTRCARTNDWRSCCTTCSPCPTRR